MGGVSLSMKFWRYFDDSSAFTWTLVKDLQGKQKVEGRDFQAYRLTGIAVSKKNEQRKQGRIPSCSRCGLYGVSPQKWLSVDTSNLKFFPRYHRISGKYPYLRCSSKGIFHSPALKTSVPVFNNHRSPRWCELAATICYCINFRGKKSISSLLYHHEF